MCSSLTEVLILRGGCSPGGRAIGSAVAILKGAVLVMVDDVWYHL